MIFGPFRLDAATESVCRDAEEIRLRPKMIAILRYLAEHPRRLVTKEELLDAMWPEVAVGEAALAVCVGEIRKLLGDDARAPRFIETVHRRGYRFIGAAPGSTVGDAGVARPDLVGREREVDRLHADLTRASRGERRIVFVTGERACELGEALGDLARLYPALWGLCFVNYSQGHYAEACRISEQLVALAERARNPDQLLEAHHTRWATLVATGDAAAAIRHIECGQRLYDPERHRAQAFLFGHHDAGTCAWYHLASARWLLGFPDAALAAVREARALADRLDHPMTTMICLCSMMWVHYHRGDLAAAEQCAHEVVALGATHGFSGWIDDGAVVLACLAPGHDASGSIGEIYERLSSGSPGRAAWRDVLCLCLLARAAADRGDVERAAHFLAAIPAEHHAFLFAAEIERIRGDLQLRRGKSDDSERCFRRAIEIARSRSERSLELRAATSLARLLVREARGDEARRMLARAYDQFTEGFDTVDLRQARTLLDDLKEAKGDH